MTEWPPLFVRRPAGQASNMQAKHRRHWLVITWSSRCFCLLLLLMMIWWW